MEAQYISFLNLVCETIEELDYPESLEDLYSESCNRLEEIEREDTKRMLGGEEFLFDVSTGHLIVRGE